MKNSSRNSSTSKRMSSAFKEVRFQDIVKQSSSRESKGQSLQQVRPEPIPAEENGTHTHPIGDSTSASERSSLLTLSHGAVSILLTLVVWNIFAILAIVRNLTSGEWRYTMYFDDAVNFIQNEDVFSFSPCTWSQLLRLLLFRGINVYEPVGSILKAVIFDFNGNECTNFRIWSVVLHFINGILLSMWTFCVLRSTRTRTRCQQQAEAQVLVVLSVAVASVYVLHPLNVEVVAWVSAQSYTLALTFYLLACLLFEHFLVLLEEESTSRQRRLWLVGTGLMTLYLLACFSKAPAITLPAVQLLRVLLLPLPLSSRVSATATSQLHKKLCYYFCGISVVAAATYKLIVFANIKGTENAVTTYSLGLPLLVRAVITPWTFFRRVLSPGDLRVHYLLPEEAQLSLQALLYGHNNEYLYSVLLAISMTLVLFVHHRQCQILTFSWFSFLAAWSPGVGLVSHGWSTFGSDRYCYLPLALLVPGAAELCSALLVAPEHCVHEGCGQSHCCGAVGSLAGTPDNKKQQKKQQQKKNENEQLEITKTNTGNIEKGDARAARSRRALLTALIGTFLVVYKVKFITHLQSWRSDKSLMESCLQHDAADWHCHYMLGFYYNDYDKDKEMSRVHHELAIAYMPVGEPKALLSKAAMYVELGQYEEACEIYRDMYASVDDMRAHYQPYVLNNYVACGAFKGVDFQHRQMANVALNKALLIIEQVGDLPSYVSEGVESHLDIIRQLNSQANSQYNNDGGEEEIQYSVNFLF